MTRSKSRTSKGPHGDAPNLGLPGVPERMLREVASMAMGDDVAEVRVDIPAMGRRLYPGKRSQNGIALLDCATASGESRRVAVFVKRLNRPGHVEAHHYRHLGKAHMPIPKMYGCWCDQGGHEVLFLERLEPYDGDDYEFMDDVERWGQFVSILARINAVQPSASYRKHLWTLRFDSWSRDWPVNWDALCGDALKGKLGRPLQELCAETQPLHRRLRRLWSRLEQPVSEMQSGLILQDCTPHQTGRRTYNGEWLVFDFELACVGPRFYDIAPWLGTRHHRSPEGRPREIASRYLEQYEHHGGHAPSIEQFLADAAMLRMTRLMVYIAWWHDRAMGNNIDPECESAASIRRICRRKLFYEVRFLLKKTEKPGSVYG